MTEAMARGDSSAAPAAPRNRPPSTCSESTSALRLLPRVKSEAMQRSRRPSPKQGYAFAPTPVKTVRVCLLARLSARTCAAAGSDASNGLPISHVAARSSSSPRHASALSTDTPSAGNVPAGRLLAADAGSPSRGRGFPVAAVSGEPSTPLVLRVAACDPSDAASRSTSSAARRSR